MGNFFKNMVTLFSKKEINDSEYEQIFTDDLTKINLNHLATQIRNQDKGEQNLSLVSVKEILGILGRRWREMTTKQMLSEIKAIYERAGLN